MHPSVDTGGWIGEYFEHLRANSLCFGVYRDGLLVCATDAPFIPYLPDRIAEPGIRTLPAYRRRGYAHAVCAAFIRCQTRAGKAVIWTCMQHNTASNALARSLGLLPFAALYTQEAAPDIQN